NSSWLKLARKDVKPSGAGFTSWSSLACSLRIKLENSSRRMVRREAEDMAKPAVWDLLYWRDVQKTACVFGATLSLLISLSLLSIISVCSYISLALLSITICFRIYRGITDALQKSENTHPFK
ncbi:reticulon-4a, partial [Tachysurus ichikawai]